MLGRLRGLLNVAKLALRNKPVVYLNSITVSVNQDGSVHLDTSSDTRIICGEIRLSFRERPASPEANATYIHWIGSGASITDDLRT